MSETAKALHHPVKIARLGEGPMSIRFSADARERERLVRLWDVVDVESFEAELELKRWRRDGVRVSGTVRSSLIQTCVVTLEPMQSAIESPVDLRLVPEGSRAADEALDGVGEVVVDPQAPDPPETFAGGEIDLGAIACEFAALAIDPYPRKPGVPFTSHIETSKEDGVDSPFAALKNWRQRDE